MDVPSQALPRQPTGQTAGHLVYEGLDVILLAVKAVKVELRRRRAIIAREVTQDPPMVGDELQRRLVPRRTLVVRRRTDGHAVLGTGVAQSVVQLTPTAVLFPGHRDLRQHGEHRSPRLRAHVGLTPLVSLGVRHLGGSSVQATAEAVGGRSPRLGVAKAVELASL